MDTSGGAKSADTIVMREFEQAGGVEPHYIDHRKHNWYADNNNSAYASNQLYYDLTGVASSGADFVSLKNAFLMLPIVYGMAGASALLQQDTQQAFAMSLKSNVLNLVHQMQIRLNNNDVVSTQPYNNVLQNFELLTHLSPSDIQIIGPTLGLEKETPSAFTFQATASNLGLGSCSTSINSAVTGAGSSENWSPLGGGVQASAANMGRIRRMQMSAWNPAVSPIPALGGTFNSSDYNKSRYLGASTVGGNTVLQWEYTAIIPLRFLHDYFEKCPLQRSAHYTLTLHHNINCTGTMAIDTNGKIASLSVQSPFKVFPFQISPTNSEATATVTGATGLRVTTGNPGTIAFYSALVKYNGGTLGGVVIPTQIHGISQTRIYIPFYTPSPSTSMSMTQSPVKTIRYHDYQCQPITGYAPSANISYMLTASLPKLRKLVIFPFYSEGYGPGGAANALVVSPLNSPFASEPSCCSPYCYYRNLQVQISTTNVYPEVRNYRFMNFLEEMKEQGVFGNQVIGLETGLISQADYDSVYGAIVVDLSRHPEAEDAQGKQIRVSFINSSNFTVDYLCFMVYEREVGVDIDSGTIVV